MAGNRVLIAFFLTLIAGLSTGIGSIIAFYNKQDKASFLSISLGFSAGVMIYLSFVEILGEAREFLISAWGKYMGQVGTITAFFLGILLTALIDRFIPVEKNPHHAKKSEDIENLHFGGENKKREGNRDLLRTGVLMALVISIHNFPEGIAAFAAALSQPSLGFSVALAIAIHNIPEGISVSVPIYYATGNRKKAFIYSLLSGLAELFGAVVGYLLLRPYIHSPVFGIILGAIAGIMVFISVDELLPSARQYGKEHSEVLGFMLGMLVTAVGLIVLG